jgi:long-chain acyl-CoA synthetase
VGEIDADGYIHITDRKKDIIVLSGGETLSPQRIEGLLTLQPEIAQAMVVGDARPHLAALVVPEPEQPNPAQGAAQAVERVNALLSPTEKVRKFTVISQPFTIENAMLTPSMKIRRHVIRDAYKSEIEGFYTR